MIDAAKKSHTYGNHPWCVLRIGTFVCLLLFCVLPVAADAAEEETHTFNATLSLTGNCSKSPTIDPVPDPSCPEEPTKEFVKHGAVAVDRYGNRYVGSTGASITSTKGRIDIFDSSGEFITQVKNISASEWEMSLAVDAEGVLYVARDLATAPGSPGDNTQRLLRYEPTKYVPAAGEIEYGDPPVAIADPNNPSGWGAFYLSVAVNPVNDRLFVASNIRLTEFGSAAEGNPYIRDFRANELGDPNGDGLFWNSFAVDGQRNRLYVGVPRESVSKPDVPVVVKVFDVAGPPELLYTIDGSTTPSERFVSESRVMPLAVDEATGHVFIGDLEAPTPRIYEFDADGNPVSTFGEGRLSSAGVGLLQMAYDDSATSPTEGYLFVPSGEGPGRSLAFEPKSTVGPPTVEGLTVSGVTTTEAVLGAKVHPQGAQTSYRFEYITEQAYHEHGDSFEGATLADEGSLSAAGEASPVSVPITGLQPGTAYRFRVVAENELGEDEADSGSFATFAALEVSADCPNQELRIDASALLPDCRAYELVTPADTNGRSPLGSNTEGFFARQVSPAGDRVPFRIKGGALPGLEGNGGENADPYLATRTASGWSTSYVGPPADFATEIVPGAGSPDQSHFLWFATGEHGPALLSRGYTSYVRYPDGHSELLGQGSLGLEIFARGKLISSGGGHIIFASQGFPPGVQPVRLEPEAAPDGTRAVYDRTGDGTLHVVSLKPGGASFDAGEDANFVGASLDGRGVVFRVGKALYLRYDNAETYAIGEEVTFAGIAEGGNRVWYLEGGDLKRFDAEAPPGESVTEFTVTGDVTPVTVSEDGSAAYFISPTAIAGSGPNPIGDEAQAGEQNLYLSREGQITFVATVTDRDVDGELPLDDEQVDGLGLWVDSLPKKEVSRVPARASADGSVLLFKARAALTGYDPAGYAQIYRFDSVAGDLQCLSCIPTGASPSSDADLQSQDRGVLGPEINAAAWVENLRADGRRAFFESNEGLVAGDVDGRRDTYEWEEQGVGSCAKPNGCIYLISSGQSGRDEYLYAVSKSGDDVFFVSSDLLAGGDGDETRSIYDARIDGGFPPPSPPSGECLGEACQPAAVAPNDPTPSSSAFEGAGNVAPDRSGKRRCPKGKRAVRSGGKVRCVRRHKRGQHARGKNQTRKPGNGNRRAGR